MNRFVLYQVVYHDDGTFKLVEIVACPKCAAMIPDNSKWWDIHKKWHETLEAKSGE